MNEYIKKTHLKKYLWAIRNSNLKYITCKDLSAMTGYKESVILEDLSFFIELVRFNPDINVVEVKDQMEEALKRVEELKMKEATSNTQKRYYIRKKDADSYTGVVDYIERYMTFAGGMLNLGYRLTKKDVRILRKLLKKEEERIKKGG